MFDCAYSITPEHGQANSKLSVVLSNAFAESKGMIYESYVIVEGEEVLLSSCEFLNIEEDISGRDLVTFNYGGKEYKSFVIQRDSEQWIQEVLTGEP